MTRIAALDPGRSKCGLVITDPSRSWIEEALVAAPETCREQLQHWQQQKALGEVLLGDGTGSPQWQQWLQQLQLPHQVVQEHGTTLAARERYWELEPARSWRRLIPQGMRLPPRDYDDVVAQILLERSLGRRLRRPQNLARTLKA